MVANKTSQLHRYRNPQVRSEAPRPSIKYWAMVSCMHNKMTDDSTKHLKAEIISAKHFVLLFYVFPGHVFSHQRYKTLKMVKQASFQQTTLDSIRVPLYMTSIIIEHNCQVPADARVYLRILSLMLHDRM